MTQNDSPNPAEIGVETPAPENVTALATVEPKPEFTAGPRPERKVDAVTPDAFAVGVRVLRMAPAWLLSVTAGCSMLIILLGWMNPGGMAHTVAYAPAPNDGRPSPAAPAAKPAAPSQPAEMTVPAEVAANPSPAPESVPAPAAPAPETPAEVQQPAQPAPAATPQAEEKPRAESPAPVIEGAGKFTAQVGSFNNPSEANERVSGLRNAGFEARAVAAELPGRGTWYRVQVGRFADRDEAAKAVASLRAKGSAGAIVVPLQN